MEPTPQSPLRSAPPPLWRDARERTRRLEAIAAAIHSGNAEALHAAVAHVDETVIAGLGVLGLPRGPMARLAIDDFGRGWIGRKMPDCHLLFDRGRLLRAIGAPTGRDEVIRT